MTWLRAGVALGAVAIAAVLQVSVFPHLAVQGVVPNLCLLVVVGAALTRGPVFGMLLGFAAGLALDLAPPADGAAGRWALALVVVGYVAGRVPRDGATDTLTLVWTVAVSSFVGTSVYALSGLLLGDLEVGIPALLQVVLLGVVWDVALTPLVMPLLIRTFAALEPDRVLVS
jgi:rod shape-determining protein MreD